MNLGLSLIYLGQIQQGLAELEEAARQKATEEHNVIDEAIRDRGEGYTVFSIVNFILKFVICNRPNRPSSPLGFYTGPPSLSLRTLRRVTSLAKLCVPFLPIASRYISPPIPWQRLVASEDPNEAYTTFSGATRLKQGISPRGAFVDLPDVSPTALNRSKTAPLSTPSRMCHSAVCMAAF